MKTSDSIKNLAEALANVQASLQPALMNSTNPFFKSKYADLNSVYESCRELLSTNGLSVTQFPSMSPIEYGPSAALTTRLMHNSGEWLEDTMVIPISKPTPQDYGSALTYARRYAISAIIGIVTDEDDDANQAQGKKKDDYPAGKPLKSVPNKPAQKNVALAGPLFDDDPQPESVFHAGDDILLHGKNDEKAGYVTAVNGDMVTVLVDGKEYTVKSDKLTLVTS